MKHFIIITSLILPTFGCSKPMTSEKPAPPIRAEVSDDALLLKVLESNCIERLVFVEPITSTRGFLPQTPANVWEIPDWVKNSVRRNVHVPGCDTDALLDVLAAKNKTPHRIACASSPENGYVIDREGKFEKYFKGIQTEWAKLKKDHPEIKSRMWVSRPAYDTKTGVVVVYVGAHSGPMCGDGSLVFYQFKNGRLEQLVAIPLWNA